MQANLNLSPGRLIDDLICVFFPERANKRVVARAEYLGVRQYLDSGRLDRTTKGRLEQGSSSDIRDTGEVLRSANAAWNIFRNNPYAKDAVKTIIAQVVGVGPKPQPQTTMWDADKKEWVADEEYRRAAIKLWNITNRTLYYRNRPGRGGMTRDRMLGKALGMTVLSGDSILRRMRISSEKAARIGSPIQIQYDLLTGNRLAEVNAAAGGIVEDEGDVIWRGVHCSKDGKRKYYYLTQGNPDDPKNVNWTAEALAVPDNEIIHLYAPDGDEWRGVSWFAPAGRTLRNTSDAVENQSLAMVAQSCVAMAIYRARRSGPLGLVAPSGETNIDNEGNEINRWQSGMVLNLGEKDRVESFSTNVNAGNTNDFMGFLLRGFASALPGVKGSSITRDYRQSSFSSEAAADNDSWRQNDVLQDWFWETACQPIWEDVIEAGFEAGFFQAEIRKNWDAEYFAENRARLIDCTWEGPVRQSINPAADARASELNIRIGKSNAQIECANDGRNWLEVLRGRCEELAAKQTEAKKAGIPVEWLDDGIAKIVVAKEAVAKIKAIENPTPPVVANTAGAKSFESNGHAHGNRVLPFFARKAAA